MHQPRAGEQGYFGNPFYMADDSKRAQVIAQHKRDLWNKVNNDELFRKAVTMLQGLRLGCFCKCPDHEVGCHGDTIKAWLEAGCPLGENHK